jgi:hypothetical protein
MEPRLLRMNSLTCAGLSEDIEMPRDKERIPSFLGKAPVENPRDNK